MKTQLHRAAHLNNRCFSKNGFFHQVLCQEPGEVLVIDLSNDQILRRLRHDALAFWWAAFTWFFTVKNGQFGRVTGAFLNLLFSPPATK